MEKAKAAKKEAERQKVLEAERKKKKEEEEKKEKKKRRRRGRRKRGRGRRGSKKRGVVNLNVRPLTTFVQPGREFPNSHIRLASNTNIQNRCGTHLDSAVTTENFTT